MRTPKHAFFKNKMIIAAVLLAVISIAGYAQVNRDELQDLPPVVFINYEGPHARLDTWEEIRQIGVGVGRQIAERERGMQPALNAMSQEERRAHSYRIDIGAANRYFVIHCVSAADGSKLDADVFGLGVDTGVDHIRNLRVIIRGYLESAYNYNARDAALLAEYITIYNAVYRGNWDYFQQRYKSQVMSNLTRDKAGLSIRYDEWPGRTLMVIPLGIGGLSAIDTSAISDSRVIEEMRREDDQGIQQRQELVNLMERESQQAERQAQQERQQIRQEETRVTEERRQTEQERQQIEQERRQTQQDQSQGRITQEEARRAQEQLDAREQQTQQREEQIARREEQIEQRREEVQKLEEFAEQKSEDAQQRREEIAQDQQNVIAQQAPSGVYGVTIERTDPTDMGRIVRLNPANGDEIRRSPLDMVHSRTVTLVGGRIIAIAGEAKGQGAVRLVEINQSSLEMAKQGDDDIKAGSLLWVNGSDLYAITNDIENNQCFLGRFNSNLEIQARSIIQVHPEAGVTIQQGRLLSQRQDGTAVILDPATLVELTPSTQVSYSVHMANAGWSNYSANGATAGTTGQNRQIEAVKIRVNSTTTGGIRYDVHAANVGWIGWNSDDEVGGTTGQNRQIEAVKIELTGQLAARYNVQYRVHMANVGWGEWVSNGETAGTTGQNRQIEAIEVRIQAK